MCMQFLQGPEEGARSHGPVVSEGCETPCECWLLGTKSSPLQEQRMTLTLKSFLRPLNVALSLNYVTHKNPPSGLPGCICVVAEFIDCRECSETTASGYPGFRLPTPFYPHHSPSLFLMDYRLPGGRICIAIHCIPIRSVLSEWRPNKPNNLKPKKNVFGEEVEKLESCALLLGISSAMETCLTVPQKLKNRTTSRTSYSIPGSIIGMRETRSRHVERRLNACISGSIHTRKMAQYTFAQRGWPVLYGTHVQWNLLHLKGSGIC